MASDDDVIAGRKTLQSSDPGLANLLAVRQQKKPHLCWHQNTNRCPWSVPSSDDVKIYSGNLPFLVTSSLPFSPS